MNTDLFDICANKSLDEIKQMKGSNQTQAIRYYFSRLLMDNTEDNPLECDIILETEEDQGLSDLEKIHITKLSQTQGEGYINIFVEGSDDWTDMENFTNEELIQILSKL